MIIKTVQTLVFEYPEDYQAEVEWNKKRDGDWVHQSTDTMCSVYTITNNYLIPTKAKHSFLDNPYFEAEPSNSEMPNNCEHITEDGVTCAKYPACDDCPDNPLNKVKGSERLVKGSEKPNNCETCRYGQDKHRYAHICNECGVGINNYEPKTEPTGYNLSPVKDEPQTYVINPQEPTNDDKCFECDDFFTCGGQCNKIEAEPQTESLEQFRVGLEYHTDTTHFGKTKGEGVSYSDHTDYKEPKTYVAWTEPRTDCSWQKGE